MTRPKKGKGTKVIITTYQHKSLVQLEKVFKYDWKVAYFYNNKIKWKKRKKILQEGEVQPKEA